MAFNRRDFLLTGSLAGIGCLLEDTVSITEKIASGVLSNAYAQQVGSKKILSLFANGAMPNWMFNLCLYPDAEVIPSAYRIPGLGTGFDINGDSVFVQQKRGDHWFPHLWFVPVPIWNGTAVSSTWESPASLLDNFLGIRGIWNPSDGHQLANRVMYKPLGANFSVHGMIADASGRPIPGVVSGNTLIAKEFTSPKGSNTLIAGSAANAINLVKGSFKEQVSLFRSNPALDTLVKSTLDKFESNSRFKTSSANFNRKKAEELVRANLANLLTDFNTKKAKYTALLNAATKYDIADSKTLIPGLLDNPITNYATGFLWNPNNDANFSRALAPSRDLREMFTTPPAMGTIADSFALAEVLFENNLSSNIVSNLGGMDIISDIVLDPATGLPFAANKSSFGFDNGHSMGISFQTFIWSVYARGFITCLYEFVSYLKIKGYYNDTVITFSSDFARSVKFNGKGSDHGWQANATSMWCGEIASPIVIGNTMLDATPIYGSNYKNLWGVGRKSPLLGNYIGVGNMNSTITSLVGVPANTSNNKALIERSGGTIHALEVAKTT